MDVPVTISGGGIIGSYISLRLQRSNINSIVIEKSEDTVSSSEGIRTLTLNPHSMAMLNNIGVSLESAAIKEIIVLDGEGTGKIQFSEKEIDSENLSYVVMFNDLRNELLALSKDKTIFNNEIQSIQNLNSEDDPEVILKDDNVIKTKLVAGCDGRNSKVASIASLKSSYNEYLQTALTFTVEAKQSKTKNAYQVFSEKGIFALMPMPKKDLDRKAFKPCKAPWQSVHINTDGNVFPCMAIPMGNIREGYDKVFNGQRFKEFRDIIRNEGLVEGCNRCGWLKSK